MKSDACTIVLPAVAAASQRPMATTEANGNRRMFRFKTAPLFLLLGLVAPLPSFASSGPYCISVDGGFGGGGTTFVDPSFAVPAEGKCSPWSGFTKTASTVILTTTGTGCLSSDGKALTVSVTSAEPSYFNIGQLTADYLLLSRAIHKTRLAA